MHDASTPSNLSVTGPVSPGQGEVDLLTGLEQQLQRLREVQREHADHAARLTEREASLSEREVALAELESELALRREAADQAALDLAERTAEINQVRASCDDRMNELAASQAQLASERNEMLMEVEAERTELQQERNMLVERQRALDVEREAFDAEVREAAAARVDLLSRQRELERLQIELDEGVHEAIAVSAEALAERDEAIERLHGEMAVLTEERQALLRRVVVLETNLTELTAQDLSGALRKELGALREERRSHLERIAVLEDGIAELRDAADKAASIDDAAHQSRISELESEIARIKDLADLASHCRDEAERDAAEARRQLEELQKQVTAAPAHQEPDVGIREKTKRLAEIARHLKLRQLRLERYRAVIQMRRGESAPIVEMPVVVASTDDAASRAAMREANLEQHAAQVRHLEQQRHEISEARRSLALKERRMIRRWAQPRAIAVTAWIGMLFCISGGLSWLIVNHLHPPTISARVDIEPRSNRVGTLPDDMLQQWQTAHLDMLGSSAFHTQVARRMKDLKLPTWENEAAVARTITQDLTTDLLDPGRITLVLAGRSRHEVSLFLDVLATTLAAESARLNRRLGDGVWAVAMGERREGDQLRYSTVNQIPIRDDRLRKIGPILGAVFGAALLIIVVVYAQLSRVKREFDEDGTLFDDEPIASTV